MKIRAFAAAALAALAFFGGCAGGNDFENLDLVSRKELTRQQAEAPAATPTPAP